MGFIATLDSIRAALEMRLDGQLCVNVLWFRTPVTADEAALNDCADVLTEWFDTEYSAVLSDQVSLQQITCRAMHVQNGLGIIRSTLGLTGSYGGTCLPNNITVSVAHRTGYVGKSARGRSYQPGIPLNATNHNVIGDVYQAASVAAWDALIAMAAGSTLIWSINSLYHNHGPRPLGVMTAVLNNTCNLTLDSQRRRLPERGA